LILWRERIAERAGIAVPVAAFALLSARALSFELIVLDISAFVETRTVKSQIGSKRKTKKKKKGVGRIRNQ